VLEGAAAAKSGAKLVPVEFPKTELQFYASSAIIYYTYLHELEKDCQQSPYSGRVTEVPVYRNLSLDEPRPAHGRLPVAG
jgi:hypothetical protein